jgi:TFIIF-interacting CTD phosphatase-like protein
MYELVIFTAAMREIADPVLDTIDIHGKIEWRLYRESCSTDVDGTLAKAPPRSSRVCSPYV